MQFAPTAPTLIDTLVPGRSLARNVALVIGFAFLVAVFAQIAIRLPFTPVPITGQTLAVLITGGALGANRGAAALALYTIAGTIGIPAFSPSNAALEGELIHFIFPWEGSGTAVWSITSGGYIVGFIAAAYVVGKLAERGWDRKWNVTVAMMIGSLLIYVPGLLWLGFAIGNGFLDSTLGFELAAVIPGNNTLDKTLIAGLYPFVVGDLIKLYIASIAIPGAWALFGRK
ncbi:MAG: biotin transporter BioY [Chloroflexi bacterium]|nr:biotin transporter BioY [Chloroflexota bacterium]